MPHRLTKRHLPHDYHATSDSRGRRTLPLQWAAPEGTFTWGGILLGAAALTYLWLRDAETQTQPPGTHLLLTLEGEAAIENVHTTEGQDYVMANADTTVWLHANKHTTPPTVVPGSHPWHVIIVQLPTGTSTGDAGQGWADSGVVPVLVGCGVSCPWVGEGSAVWHGGAGLRGGLLAVRGGGSCPDLVGWVVAGGWSSGGVGQSRAVFQSSLWRFPVRGPRGIVAVRGLGSPGARCVGWECRNQGGVSAWCLGVSAHR